MSTAQAAELAQVALSPAPTSLKPAESAPVPIPAAPEEPEAGLRTAEVRSGDLIVYPTLAAAVAAQDVSAEDEALRCLATTIYFESKGEPLAGQLAVAQVVINRVAAGRFGQGVCGVIRQRGQFSFVRGGQIPSVDSSNRAYRTALAVAKVALAEAWDSEAERALYFNSRPMSGRTHIASIGNHRFYR